MLRLHFPAFLVALSLTAAAQPQTTPPKVSESVDVSLVNIDFVALDGKGNPIRDLDPSTVTVLEDGKPQPITNFAQYKRPMSVEGAAPSTPEHVAFFFDDNSLTASTRRRIILAAEEYAKRVAARGANVEIVAYDHQIDVIQESTNDLAAILGALEKLSKRAPNGAIREAERRRLQAYINSAIADGEAAAPTGQSTSLEMIVAGVKHYAEQRAEDVDRTADALARYLESLRRVEGRKAVIVASESLPSRPGSDMYQFLGNVLQRLANDPTSTYSGPARRSSAFMESSRFQKGSLLHSVGDVARASRVVLYGINPEVPGESKSGTVERTAPGGAGDDFAAGLGSMDGLQILSAATGGQAYIGMYPDKALQRIDDELGSYYSLAYRGTADAQHRVELRSSVPGVKFRYARTLAPAPIREAESHEPVDLDDFSGDNRLNIAVQRGDSTSEGGARKVQLKILIPVDNLKFTQQPSGEYGGGFSVYLQFKNRNGSELSTINKQSHQFRLTADQVTAAKGKTITFVSDVVIRDGRDQVNVRVVDDESKASGFATVDLSS